MAGFDNTIQFSSGERLTQSSITDIARMQYTSDSVSRINYPGNPEGNVSANPSSLSHNPMNGNFYLKVTGTGNTGWQLLNPSGMQGLSDDVNTFVSPAGSPSKIQLFGHVVEQGATKFSTVVAGTNLININPMSSARWIVDSLGFNGTHTSLTAAYASSTSGDSIFMLPGTYTEDPVAKPGVSVTASLGDSFIPNVIINGKITYSGVGLTCLSNVCLQTNNDYYLEVNGSSASSIRLTRCFLNTLNHTGINFTSSSSDSLIRLDLCTEAAGTSGITLITKTSPGSFIAGFSTISGGTTTASTLSAGSFNIQSSYFSYPIVSSGTSGISAAFSTFNANGIALTLNGPSSSISQCIIASGANAAVSIGAGAVANVVNSNIISTATNVFTGLGQINTGGNVCTQSSGNNVSTINHLTVI
jgi:hypothetical protein